MAKVLEGVIGDPALESNSLNEEALDASILRAGLRPYSFLVRSLVCMLSFFGLLMFERASSRLLTLTSLSSGRKFPD